VSVARSRLQTQCRSAILSARCSTTPSLVPYYHTGPSTGPPFPLRGSSSSPNLPSETADYSFICHVSRPPVHHPPPSRWGYSGPRRPALDGTSPSEFMRSVPGAYHGLCPASMVCSTPSCQVAASHSKSQQSRRTQACTLLASAAQHCNPPPSLSAFRLFPPPTPLR
jgi:hypothetical protein